MKVVGFRSGFATGYDRGRPPEVKALVEEMRAGADGSLRVRFVSKTAAMALAAKHQLGGRNNVVVHQINWDGLVRSARKDEPDPIEERTRAVEALPHLEEGSGEPLPG